MDVVKKENERERERERMREERERVDGVGSPCIKNI